MDIKKEVQEIKKRIADLEKEIQDLQKNKISLSDLTEHIEKTFKQVGNYSSK